MHYEKFEIKDLLLLFLCFIFYFKLINFSKTWKDVSWLCSPYKGRNHITHIDSFSLFFKLNSLSLLHQWRGYSEEVLPETCRSNLLHLCRRHRPLFAPPSTLPPVRRGRFVSCIAMRKGSSRSIQRPLRYFNSSKSLLVLSLFVVALVKARALYLIR